MRPAKKTKSAIKKLSPADVKKLLHWIDKRLDDELGRTGEAEADSKGDKKPPPPGATAE